MDKYIYIGDKKVDKICNASGCWASNYDHFKSIIDSGKETIITKTCTLQPRSGNEDPVFTSIKKCNASLNCIGLANPGFRYYKELWWRMYEDNITYIISMDASNFDDLKTMLLEYDEYLNGFEKVTKSGIRELVELNISCPNIKKKTEGRLISYDTNAFQNLLEIVDGLGLKHIYCGVKMSPFIDKYLLAEFAKLILQYHHIIKYVVCSNSIPNGMVWDNVQQKPKLSMGYGGISGEPAKLISLANCHQFNQIFNDIKTNSNPRVDIKIIGCGGIENAEDIKSYLQAGANGVQLGRSLYISGVKLFSKL